MDQSLDLAQFRLHLDAHASVRVLSRLDDPDVLSVLLLLAFHLLSPVIVLKSHILSVARSRFDMEC